MNPHRFVYLFGAGQAEGGSEVKHLVGGKGASLADLTRAGFNVPPGFTLSAECCDHYHRSGKRWPKGLEEEVRTNLARLEELTGRRLGRGDDPLLVSVRSGAAESMPGMMDTVLNVGLNPECVAALAGRSADPRAVWQAFRQFLLSFGETVARFDETVVRDWIADWLRRHERVTEEKLTAEELQELCEDLIAEYPARAGRAFPSEPWEQLRQAIDAVFDSWNSERAVLFRERNGIEGLLGTAVNVQAMCPSEVSGVLFTADPVHPDREQLVIEASYGLGEAIVLGKVTPDRFVLHKQTLEPLERVISDKQKLVVGATGWPLSAGDLGMSESGGQPVPPEPSLSDAQLIELARLGLKVEGHFQTPCDIEWAWAEGRFWLLQSRPIRSKAAGERERVRQEEIATARSKAESGGTVWARYNLAEVLPAPTPMTWAVVRRFMSGRGGFGLAYRDLGFDPEPVLDEEGFIDLICGRPYVNLSREPRLFFRDFPYGHSFVALKANPERALYPQPAVLPERTSGRFWLRLPLIFWKMLRAHSRMKRQSAGQAELLRRETFPRFAEEVRGEQQADLATLSPAELRDRFQHWTDRTLTDFARRSLKPSIFAGLALANLERGLARVLPAEEAAVKARELLTGVRPDPEADLAGALQDLTAGKLARERFLEHFGHRGPGEMELAEPRWAEKPDQLPHGLLRSGTRQSSDSTQADRNSGEFRYERGSRDAADVEEWRRLVERVELPVKLQRALEPEFHKARTYFGLRETAKHYLMMGYALIRRCLIELDRRFQLDGGVFYLVPEELPRLIAGEDLASTIRARRQRQALALSLEVPAVLFSDALEAIGRPAAIVQGIELKGTPLSAGVAEAAALVLEKPALPADAPSEFVLVCPSTDPAWLPLFLRAKALVMETGGVLSHGAIVARELGLPAVAGIPDVHKRLRTAQRLHVDGRSGRVVVRDGQP